MTALGNQANKNQFSHLADRAGDRLEAIFQDGQSTATPDHLILTSGHDLGVCRNGGRRGASFAPKAILAVFKKMALHPRNKSQTIKITPVDVPGEEEDFVKFQQKQAGLIQEIIEQNSNTSIIHLGGGHDHIYPFLLGLNYHKKITVLNIDAHLDTRLDTTVHSGTPFRQFSQEARGEFNLIQLGIHNFCNVQGNYQKLKRGKMEIISSDQLERASAKGSLPEFLRERLPLESNALTILSLDCDGLSCAYMESVSAVNPHGLSMQTVRDIFNYYRNGIQHPPIAGIYEYNPLYDNLSQKGAKTIAALLYSLLFD